MVVLVKLLGVAMVVLGVIFLTSPRAIKKYMAFWAKGKRAYAGGVLSILIGILLLAVAVQCRVPWFVVLLGIWAVIKGIFLFTLGPEKITSQLKWWAARPLVILRIVALLALTFGTLLICSA